MLTILLDSDPILRQKATPVELKKLDLDKQWIKEERAEFERNVFEMFVLMDTHKGLGLAAPQVGISKRFFTLKIDGQPALFINPQIMRFSKEREILEEGCLSFPGKFMRVERPRDIEVAFWNAQGNFSRARLDKMYARAFQHEYDHLNGVLFSDPAGPTRKPISVVNG